ncbi:MAG TPA: S41 family peptidase [Gemmatimonadaceae bacterium]|nr:S41 family peptidase [Gemmatimonadaceae bacterium]
MSGFRQTRTVVVAAALAAAAGVAIVVGMAASRQSKRDERDARLFDEVRRLVATRDVDSISDDSLFVKAANGMVSAIGDPYASLFSRTAMAGFLRNDIGNAYGGLGMSLERQPGGIAVTGVFQHSPAALGGVMTGDEIVAINGTPVARLPRDRVSQLLVGEPGSGVDLTFLRAGITTPIRTHFVRAIVRPQAVPFAMVIGDHTGYIPLQRFNETADSEMASAVAGLKQRGARSFVIDLRGNPGGDVAQALAVSNLFLRAGQEIAELRQRGEPAQSYRARIPPLVRSEPVVLLVDHYTASASEIVAGALQDHDRAVIVGETSFGKGVVQSLFNLDGGYALKLTTGRWYTPSGRSIQRAHTFDGAPDTSVNPLADTAPPAHRPRYKSDDGRTVLGGGGITPDVTVASDTLTSAEQHLAREFAPKAAQTRTALFDVARGLRTTVRGDFIVLPEWREAFYRQLRASGVNVDRATFEAAEPWVDRLLEQQIATIAFGDSSAFRRSAPSDAPLQRALTMLEHASTQSQLWSLAQRGVANGL